MALSKPLPSVTTIVENMTERVNKLEKKKYNGVVLVQEILQFCEIHETKVISIDAIRKMIGTDKDMVYPCIEVQDSFDCYEFCRSDLLEKLQETKFNIEFFEDRITSNANVLMSVISKGKKQGNCDQIMLWCVIRMMLYTHPKVGFCRYFRLTGVYVL